MGPEWLELSKSTWIGETKCKELEDSPVGEMLAELA